MTIQMLTSYPLGRYTIPAGVVVGLFDAATEAGLIAAKQAIASAAAANWTVPVDNPRPASLNTDEVAQVRGVVSGAGNITAADLSTTTGTLGQTVRLSDGPDQGAILMWSTPQGASSPTWCWWLWPQAAY